MYAAGRPDKGRTKPGDPISYTRTVAEPDFAIPSCWPLAQPDPAFQDDGCMEPLNIFSAENLEGSVLDGSPGLCVLLAMRSAAIKHS